MLTSLSWTRCMMILWHVAQHGPHGGVDVASLLPCSFHKLTFLCPATALKSPLHGTFALGATHGPIQMSVEKSYQRPW